jgi:hypothetical protein
MFVRNAMRDGGEQARQRRTPPDIFVVGGAATENGTRLAFGGASATFAEDRWRYRGGIGRSDIHLQFYGIGGSLGGGERSIGYALDGWMSNQQLLRRLGDGDNWLGVRWIDLDLDSKADLAGNPDAGLSASSASGSASTSRSDPKAASATSRSATRGADRRARCAGARGRLAREALPIIAPGCGCSSMAERQLPKLHTRVRFPSPAPRHRPQTSAKVRFGLPYAR